MIRKWQMYVWTGKGYRKPTTDGTIEANGPTNAVKKFGLTDPIYDIRYSRKGYGHFTGRVEIRDRVTIAAGSEKYPLPADFLLLVED